MNDHMIKAGRITGERPVSLASPLGLKKDSCVSVSVAAENIMLGVVDPFCLIFRLLGMPTHPLIPFNSLPSTCSHPSSFDCYQSACKKTTRMLPFRYYTSEREVHSPISNCNSRPFGRYSMSETVGYR